MVRKWRNTAYFNALQQEKIIAIKVEVLALDSTSCKLHHDAHGALKTRTTMCREIKGRMEYQASRGIRK